MKNKNEKIAKFKMLSFCQSVIFSVSYIFMQMFNESSLCLQSGSNVEGVELRPI